MYPSAGIDWVTVTAIEEAGVEPFLQQIRDGLVSGAYRLLRNRRQEITKGNGKVRVLGIPSIRDRVIQGMLKLILLSVADVDDLGAMGEARAEVVGLRSPSPTGR